MSIGIKLEKTSSFMYTGAESLYRVADESEVRCLMRN